MLLVTAFIGLILLAAWQLVTALLAINTIVMRDQNSVQSSTFWASGDFDRNAPEETTPKETTPDDTWGRAVVVLCLRGNDPMLVDVLRCLIQQNYDDYVFRIIVDSEQDPAWQSIKASGVDQSVRTTIDVLCDPPNTCSLKNAALIQTLGSLEADFKFLVLVDADTLTHPSWLRELLIPLRDPAVGLTTGVRWYHPQRCTLAALTRVVWNAAATTQMIGFGIPWGGSMAISLRSVDPEGLLKIWSQGLCEDTMMTNHLKSLDRRQQFVPSIIMLNREDCGMRDLMRWIKRQLIVARLYHPSWKLTVAHGLASSLIPLAVLILIVWQWWAGNVTAAANLAIGFLAYQVAMVTALMLGQVLVLWRLSTLGRHANWLSTTAWIGLPMAVIVIQILYPFVLLQAMFARKVEWRAMSYRIQSNGSVIHEGYQAYPTEPAANSLRSL